MAFTQFATQAIPPSGDATITYSAVDGANGNAIVNNGKLVLLIKNGSGAGITVTVVSVADEHGRTGDNSVPIAAGAEACVGLMDPALWNQRSGDVGEVHVTFSSGTSVTMAALSLG